MGHAVEYLACGLVPQSVVFCCFVHMFQALQLANDIAEERGGLPVRTVGKVTVPVSKGVLVGQTTVLPNSILANLWKGQSSMLLLWCVCRR